MNISYALERGFDKWLQTRDQVAPHSFVGMSGAQLTNKRDQLEQQIKLVNVDVETLALEFAKFAEQMQAQPYDWDESNRLLTRQ